MTPLTSLNSNLFSSRPFSNPLLMFGCFDVLFLLLCIAFIDCAIIYSVWFLCFNCILILSMCLHIDLVLQYVQEGCTPLAVLTWRYSARRHVEALCCGCMLKQMYKLYSVCNAYFQSGNWRVVFVKTVRKVLIEGLTKIQVHKDFFW